jgi:hypothetical protein
MMARTGPAHKVKTVKPNKRYQSMMAASVKQQKKKTRGYATPVSATRKQETGSYYGTTGSRGRVSGRVMPAHTTQKEKAASAASKLAKQAAAYKKARAGGSGSMSAMQGMLAAAGGDVSKLKAIHAAAYPSGSSLPKKNGATTTKTGTKTTGTAKTGTMKGRSHLATTRLTPAQRRRSLLARHGGPLRGRQG